MCVCVNICTQMCMYVYLSVSVYDIYIYIYTSVFPAEILCLKLSYLFLTDFFAFF